MTNSYFNAVPLSRFTTADAIRLNSIFNAIEAGFDKLPSQEEMNQGTRNFAIATGSANTYAVSVSYQLTSYVAGLQVRALIMIANTGPSTLNVNGVGQSTIKRADGTNLQSGDLRASSLNDFTFDGTAFRLTSFHGASEAITSANAATATAAASQALSSAVSSSSSAASALASQVTASSAATQSTSTLTATRFGFRNAIMNPVFWITNPLGNIFSGTYTAGKLIRDRWRAGPSGITFSIASYTMTITAGSIQQTIQGRNVLQGGSYTLSWNGTSSATVNGTAVSNGGTITLAGASNVVIVWGPGTLHHPQFEFSPTKTQFEIRPTDIEISLCSQYYQKSYSMETALATATFAGVNYSVTYNTTLLLNGQFNYPVKMRAIPTITIYSPATGLTGRIFMEASFDAVINVVNLNESNFYITCNAGSFIAGRVVFLHWVADAEL